MCHGESKDVKPHHYSPPDLHAALILCLTGALKVQSQSPLTFVVAFLMCNRSYDSLLWCSLKAMRDRGILCFWVPRTAHRHLKTMAECQQSDSATSFLNRQMVKKTVHYWYLVQVVTNMYATLCCLGRLIGLLINTKDSMYKCMPKPVAGCSESQPNNFFLPNKVTHKHFKPIRKAADQISCWE